MSQRIVPNAVIFALVNLAASLGCAGQDDESSVSEAPAVQQDALSTPAKRCNISGDPPVEQGCEPGESCVPYACTNSIPPSCAGTCKKPQPLKFGRCDVSGDPPVTVGCSGGQSCVVEACTNSIPPHCFGRCE
jgi:hypothetical protein